LLTCSGQIRFAETDRRHLNAAICMTEGPAQVNVAVAVLLPAVVTALSSTISPSGVVIARDVNPVPAALVKLATKSAPKINSLATVVVAAEQIWEFALCPGIAGHDSCRILEHCSHIRVEANRSVVEAISQRISAGSSAQHWARSQEPAVPI
jgi:hypothetical protein